MPILDMSLDGDGAPRAIALRTCLRLLAQRGAKLKAQGGGAIVEAPRKGDEIAVAWIEGPDVAALAAAGWLTDIGEGRYILSPSGRAVVRIMKAAPSPADAGAGSSPMTTTSPPPPLPRPTAPVATDSPLNWLRARRNKDGTPYLCDEAFQAGERLRLDFERARIMPRVTADWEAIPRTRDEQRGIAGLSRERGGGASDAHERVNRALAAMPPELCSLILDVCCYGYRLQEAEKRNGMPQRSVHYLLDIGLRALARHYGLLPPIGVDWRPRPNSRHWGSDDYRPTMDGA